MTAPSPHREAVLSMALDGKTTSEIATALGIENNSVTGIKVRLRRSGNLPEFEPSDTDVNRLSRIKAKYGTRFGGIYKLILLLDPEVLKWLLDETPKDALLIDTIRSILVDAYHEENDL